MVDAHLHEGRNRGVLPLTQSGEAAPEHLIWKTQIREEVRRRRRPGWTFGACPLPTLDVALVSDGLQRGPARQELLQLVSGLLVVGGVDAGGALHGCRRGDRTGQDRTACPALVSTGRRVRVEEGGV